MNSHRNVPPKQYHALAPILGNTGQPDTPENRARMERVLDAADGFEIVDGRAVQLRNPGAGQPVPGVRYF
jgi:hypothetical protein